MATTLKSIVPFLAIPPGGQATLPHNLNWDGRPVTPDECSISNGSFSLIAASALTITFQNNGDSVANLDVLCESWHTLERAFGAVTATKLSIQPFVVSNGGPSNDTFTDGVTIKGDGSSVNPIALKAVLHDATLTGNGVIGSLLSAVAQPATGPANAVGFFGAAPPTAPLGGDPNFLAVDNVNKNLFIGALTQQSEIFINQGGALNGSNSGIQHSSDVANRAQIRENQYGANAGVPGISSFKSRGAIGVNAPVIAGDVLFRATAVGAADATAIPLAGMISINADFVSNAAPPGFNYVATSFDIQLVPLEGPINSRKQVFRIDPEGVFHVIEATGPKPNTMAGVATLGVGGTVVVPNTLVNATSRFMYSVQPGGTVVAGVIQVTATVPGVSFTLTSSSPTDAGALVYWQIWEPTTTM